MENLIFEILIQFDNCTVIYSPVDASKGDYKNSYKAAIGFDLNLLNKIFVSNFKYLPKFRSSSSFNTVFWTCARILIFLPYLLLLLVTVQNYIQLFFVILRDKVHDVWP